jgi:hypothetical protein
MKTSATKKMNKTTLQQTAQYVPLKCLLPALKNGIQIVNTEGCRLFIWNNVSYYEIEANADRYSDDDNEWDVKLCMKPAEL